MSQLTWWWGLAIIVLWGVWGFTAKIAAQKIGMQVLVWSLAAQAVIALAYLALTKQLWPLQTTSSAVWGLAVGASAALSSILFYLLMQRHPASLIVSLTALYPAVTVLLSVFFLREALSPTQIAGIVLALIAGVLLTR
jgi:transporter family protein